MQDKNQRNPCRAACLFLDAHQQHSIAKQLSNVQAKALGISSNKPALPRIVTLQRAVQGPRAGLRVTPPTVKSGTCKSLSLHGPQGWGHCAGHPGSSGHIQMSRCVQLFHLNQSKLYVPLPSHESQPVSRNQPTTDQKFSIATPLLCRYTHRCSRISHLKNQ